MSIDAASATASEHAVDICLMALEELDVVAVLGALKLFVT
jgi:hypothetical protein